MRQSAENMISNTHIATCKAIKPIKRAILGEGSMMRTFRLIQEAAVGGDRETLQRIHLLLMNTMPPFWQGRHEKQIQLILLCRFCLGTREERNIIYHELLTHLHDYAHELTREITAFLANA